MSKKNSGNQNPKNAKVLQLGFNISVSGDPDTDVQIHFDDKHQKALQSSSKNELQPLPSTDLPQLKGLPTQDPSDEVENKENSQQNNTSTESCNMSETAGETAGSSDDKDISIIKDIKNTMEHFERFSDHIKEAPRFKSNPKATSTPFSNKANSKSVDSLVYQDYYRPRKYSHLNNYYSRNSYLKGSVRPPPSDLYLRPLPGEHLYARGIIPRYFNLEPCRQYGSYDSLSKPFDYKSLTCSKSNYDVEKYELEKYPSGILKKSDSESGDKQSTSSADSVKDIKIYQSGGILIMQNFKENFDLDKKEISEFSAKLIENCNKLKEEINNEFSNIEDKSLVGNEEVKNPGKTVQFDLSGCENRRSKSGDSLDVSKDDSSLRIESSESTSDCMKSKDTSPHETSQSQDFPSFSTQENDSVISNIPAMSPTYNTSGKKLEWDSGADVGYLNVDLSKENLSTIERIVLKGLTRDGFNEKRIVYEKKQNQPQTSRSKFILERMTSEIVIEDIIEPESKSVKEIFKGGDNLMESTSQSNDDFDKYTSHDYHVKESSPKEVMKDESIAKPVPEPSPSIEVKTSSKQETSREEHQKAKLNESRTIDKSVNVNTLFEDDDCQVPLDLIFGSKDFKQIEVSHKPRSSRLSPKVKKLKKKKNLNQKKNLTASLKDKIDTIIDIARTSSRSSEDKLFEMGIPKSVVYKKFEVNPELSDLELSREIEEIVIDQRFKIKQNLAGGRDVTKSSSTLPVEVKNNENKKGVKTKSRPISASSSSNNTVLPNVASKEESQKKADGGKFVDQVIQTKEYEVESVGIQAFSSQKSSLSSTKNYKNPPKNIKPDKDEVLTSSKNIQAFGLNSSLPRQLAHPKEAKMVVSQNTKSTQFFGGPINSLPNYHSNLITKPIESCGRMPKILKSRKNLETEIIRLNEENRRKTMANGLLEKIESNKCKDAENKENLVVDKETNSKKSPSLASLESSKKYDSACNEVSEGSRSKSKSNCNDLIDQNELQGEISVKGPDDVRPSDEVSNKVLTSAVLKEHGDSIDRNIIQEKYFQSQLMEFEIREMISKGTSMERRVEKEGNTQTTLPGKTSVTVGCQYSPQSKDNTSEGQSEDRVQNKKDRHKIEGKSKPLEKYNETTEVNFGTNEQDCGTGDSLPSSTQTAYSWIPGMQDGGYSKSGVGRARSFEYLPGHIYESTGNIREELPNESEHIVVTGSSLVSSESDLPKGSVDNGVKDSEGRNTLVLENSDETPQDSNRMKILDDNLTQLDLVVSKLKEKDAQIQSLTRSLMINYWKKNGSGDSRLFEILGATDTSKVEVIDSNASPEVGDFDEKNCAGSWTRKTKEKKRTKEEEGEVSIACQTEDKLSSSSHEKFFEERKALEKRISEGKESQIKWIENEIHHLNILRDLLEKKSFSNHRKKKNSVLSLTPGGKCEEIYPKNILADVYTRPFTPVYGCTISLGGNSQPCDRPITPPENSASRSAEMESSGVSSDPTKLAMAVSVSGGSKSLRRVVTFPVGVQVTLKDLETDSSSEEETDYKFIPGASMFQVPRTLRSEKKEEIRMDADTQCPSFSKNSDEYSTTIRSISLERCDFCQQESCVCLDLSEKSDGLQSPSSQNSHEMQRDTLQNSDKNIRGKRESKESKRVVSLSSSLLQDLVSYELSKSIKRKTDSMKLAMKNATAKSPVCKCQNCPGRVDTLPTEQDTVERTSQSESAEGEGETLGDRVVSRSESKEVEKRRVSKRVSKNSSKSNSTDKSIQNRSAPGSVSKSQKFLSHDNLPTKQDIIVEDTTESDLLPEDEETSGDQGVSNPELQEIENPRVSQRVSINTVKHDSTDMSIQSRSAPGSISKSQKFLDALPNKQDTIFEYPSKSDLYPELEEVTRVCNAVLQETEKHRVSKRVSINSSKAADSTDVSLKSRSIIGSISKGQPFFSQDNTLPVNQITVIEDPSQSDSCSEFEEVTRVHNSEYKRRASNSVSVNSSKPASTDMSINSGSALGSISKPQKFVTYNNTSSNKQGTVVEDPNQSDLNSENEEITRVCDPEVQEIENRRISRRVSVNPSRPDLMDTSIKGRSTAGSISKSQKFVSHVNRLLNNQNTIVEDPCRSDLNSGCEEITSVHDPEVQGIENRRVSKRVSVISPKSGSIDKSTKDRSAPGSISKSQRFVSHVNPLLNNQNTIVEDPCRSDLNSECEEITSVHDPEVQEIENRRISRRVSVISPKSGSIDKSIKGRSAPGSISKSQRFVSHVNPLLNNQNTIVEDPCRSDLNSECEEITSVYDPEVQEIGNRRISRRVSVNPSRPDLMDTSIKGRSAPGSISKSQKFVSHAPNNQNTVAEDPDQSDIYSECEEIMGVCNPEVQEIGNRRFARRASVIPPNPNSMDVSIKSRNPESLLCKCQKCPTRVNTIAKKEDTFFEDSGQSDGCSDWEETSGNHEVSNSEFQEIEHHGGSKGISINTRMPNTVELSIKTRSAPSPVCTCEKYSKHVNSPSKKQNTIVQDPHQSDLSADGEKTSQGRGMCCCSKVQVKKSSCNCHIIKIVGPHRCKSESATCSCRRKSSVKRTENQSCQTEEEFVAASNKRSLVFEELWPRNSKVTFSTSQPLNPKIAIEEKTVIEKQVPSGSGVLDVKIPTAVKSCGCQTSSKREKREKREKPEGEHPRHYFLKIEEKEVGDSNESIQRKKSLEVITVTVPVKKAGKAKLYGSKVNQSQRKHNDDERNDTSTSGCNCCEACKSFQKGTRSGIRDSYDYHKEKLQKGESPKPTNRIQKIKDCDCCKGCDNNAVLPSYDDDDTQTTTTDESNDSIVDKYIYSKNFSSKEIYDTKNNENTPSAKSQSEHDTSMTFRNDSKTNYYNEEEDYDDFQTPTRDVDGRKFSNSIRDSFQAQKSLNNTQKFDSDYYNYNKKEFMTKSELLKEDKKKKVRYRSLQEYLLENRPDFYHNAEIRRNIISERARDRMRKHTDKMECLINLINICEGKDRLKNAGPKRIFTTSQIHNQTMRRYRNLPEVTGKIADQKKKEEYKTNRLMADVYAKKLQLETLKGSSSNDKVVASDRLDVIDECTHDRDTFGRVKSLF